MNEKVFGIGSIIIAAFAFYAAYFTFFLSGSLANWVAYSVGVTELILGLQIVVWIFGIGAMCAITFIGMLLFASGVEAVAY